MAVVFSGCGLGGAEGGGSDHLPTSGAGPYGKLGANRDTPAEEPFVVVDTTALLEDPSVVHRDGGFDVWFTHTLLAGGPTEIWHAHFVDIAQRPDVDPEPALAAGEAWDLGVVARPSVLELEDGSLVMYYQGGADDSPAIGRATSVDGGASWTRDGLVLEAARDPSALALDGRILLYYGAPDGSAISVATSDDGLVFERSLAPVMVRRDTEPMAFDAAWIGEPNAVGGRTVTGQTRIGLFFVGRSLAMEYAIGRADSADGQDFVRFFNGEAILQPGSEDERGPSAVILADRGFLFFAQKRIAATGIAVAVHP